MKIDQKMYKSVIGDIAKKMVEISENKNPPPSLIKGGVLSFVGKNENKKDK
jgi:hypothetical protein